MPTTINIYGMRHGGYDADGSLNDIGRRQVSRATNKHLAGIEMKSVIHSGVLRAQQSAKLIAELLNLNPVKTATNIDEALGIDEALELDWIDNTSLPKLEWSDDNDFTCARDYLNSDPPAWALAGRAFETLCWNADLLVPNGPNQQTSEDCFNMTFVSHCPVIELAAAIKDPDLPLLDNGDIIHFVFEFEKRKAPKLTNVTYLPCPS